MNLDGEKELCEVIRSDDYDEGNALRIMIFCDSLIDGDTPAMALAMAKNIDAAIDGDMIA